MNVTLSEIQIVPVRPRAGLLAFVSFVFNGTFYVGDVAIYSRLNGDGYRLSYPMRILPNGLKVDCFHPITREAGQEVERQVFEAFRRLIQEARERQGRHYGDATPVSSHMPSHSDS